jgi:hypothetical protein
MNLLKPKAVTKTLYFFVISNDLIEPDAPKESK